MAKKNKVNNDELLNDVDLAGFDLGETDEDSELVDFGGDDEEVEYTDDPEESVEEESGDSYEEEDTEAEEEPVKKKVKKSKKGKKGDEPAEEEPLPDKTLVLLMDRQIPNFLAYCRQVGLNVHSIFYTVEDCESFCMFKEGIRLVIFETGIGKFNSVALREKISSLIGSADETREISVFYTDSVLRMDVKSANREAFKRVTWHKYKTSLISISELVQYKENFVFNGTEQEAGHVPNRNELLHYRGKKVNVEDVRRHPPKAITPKVLMQNMLLASGGEYEELQAFKPKY